MWGAIGGAVGGGTTQVLKNVGSKALGKVGKKVIENGVDMVVDLTQTATENGGLTGKDVLICATMSFGGELISSVKTNSTVRNQLVDGVTDNKAVKNAVTDNKAVKNAVADSASNASKRYDPDQQALIELAKDAKKNGGVTSEEADILLDWAEEYNVNHHGPETHPDRPGPASNVPHIHIGKTGHIPIK